MPQIIQSNIVSDLMHYARITRGEYHYFNQVSFIMEKQWSADNPRKLKGGAWIGEHQTYEGKTIYGHEGICTGLSAAFLLTPPCWARFRAYLDTQEARSIIMGVMNYQSQISANNKIPSPPTKKSCFPFMRKNKVKNVMPIRSKQESLREILRVESKGNVIYIKTVRLPNKNTIEERIQDLMAAFTGGTRFEIGIYMGSDAHSITMKIQNGYMHFFDCNVGYLCYLNNHAGRTRMDEALCMLLSEYYPQFNRIVIDVFT